MYYAVYGSLMKGYWNHDWALSDAEFVARTTIEGFTLKDNGCFPAAIRKPDEQIHVEIYDVTNVDEYTIENMDHMEFNCGYERSLVRTSDGDECWLFVMPEVLADRFHIDVPNNDWRLMKEEY